MAITMAGMGSRFKKAGYHQPKYEIEVLGHPLFDWSMLSLTAFRDAGWRFCFATSKDMQAKPYIAARCKALGIIIDDVIELDHVTDGQATTALLLAQKAPSDAPFAVYNIDTFVRPGLMAPPIRPSVTAGFLASGRQGMGGLLSGWMTTRKWLKFVKRCVFQILLRWAFTGSAMRRCIVIFITSILPGRTVWKRESATLLPCITV